MRRKILIMIAFALLVIVLTPVLYYYYSYVPNVLGKQYVSVSHLPRFYTDPLGSGNIEVMYNGRIFRIGLLAISINVTNNYFVPVHFKYNGFPYVWLIYNQTVFDPSDVVNNRNSLVWGAFYCASPSGVYTFGGDSIYFEDGFEYYVNRRELSNFTKTIESGTYSKNYVLFMPPGTVGGSWYGQYWFDHLSYVSTGTYYMYCIIFGIVSGPVNFTILQFDEPK